MNTRTRITIALGGAAVALAAAACSSGPGAFTTKGTVQDCTGALSAGDQVTVADASGKILGASTLAEDNSAAAAALVKEYDAVQLPLSQFGGSSSGMTIYDFTVAGLPGGEQRYGVSVGASHGTIWFTPAQMTKGPGLTLGC